ncbi:MAG: nucleotidyltransferase [Candidatus Omnitrophota bacterium]
MNPLESQIKALVEFLSSQKIKYVILGGIAVSIYGEPRFTADVDVNIILDKTGIDKFLELSKKSGFFPLFPNTKKIAKESGVIPMKHMKGKVEGRCDVIIAENALEYAAIKRGRLRKIGSVMARLVTPEDLIIHKITSFRPRDAEDLKGILIRQKGKLDIGYISEWLTKIDKAAKKSRSLSKLFDRLVDSYYK